MAAKKSVEELYVESAGKLRASFPKFVMFLGFAYSIWIISTTYFIPLSRGVFIGAIEAARLDSILILAVVLIFVIGSFIEIKKVAESCAGLVVGYVVHRENGVDEVRYRKMRRTFSVTFFIIPAYISFLIFNNLLEQINPMFNTIIPILFVIWAVIAAVMLSMVVGLEVEEAARMFTDKINRVRKKKR